MKIVDVVIGSSEWLASRSASKAPAMMGANPYQSRNDLIRIMATGIAGDVDAATQARFDAGHAAEAATRKLVEAKLKHKLPALTATSDDGYLLASFDGISGTTGWECKLWHENLAAQVRAKELDPMYYWQLEQQIIVGGLKRVIFTVSDGTPEKCLSMEYRPVPGRAEQLLAGWKQFDEDLADYKPVEVLPAAVAAPTMALPALSVQVRGEIQVIDNLKMFGERLGNFIEGIEKNPSDDQAFADAEAAIKILGTAETELEAEKARALAQIAAVDEMTRTVALYAAQARNCRLMLTKLVKDRKEFIRVKIVQGGRKALGEHVAYLNLRLGRAYLTAPAENFAGVIKGMKTVSSIRNAVDSELARCKIEANVVADRIGINMKAMDALDPELNYTFLFSDAASILLKENDDFLALAKIRISEHKAAEAKRIEMEAEKARERIRAEEAVKAKAEQERIARAEREAQDKLALEMHQREESLTRERRESEANLAKEQAAARAGIEPITKPEFSPELAAAAAPYGRPRDDALIAAVALAFDTNADIARRWLVEAFAGRMAA